MSECMISYNLKSDKSRLHKKIGLFIGCIINIRFVCKWRSHEGIILLLNLIV